MNVAHVLPWISRNAGGLFHSVAGLARAQAELPGTRVAVFGVEDEFSAADRAQWQPVIVHTAAGVGPARLAYAPAMRRMLEAYGPNLIHSAAVWTGPAAVVNQIHARTGVPLVVSPRGTLDAWALQRSRWKKALALWLFQRRHFARAACIHALTEAELAAVRAFGLRNPVCVIPNGVELPDLAKAEIGNTQSRNASELSALPISDLVSGRRILLYLGRIHPKKGLVNLIRAWGAINRKSKIEDRTSGGWVLVIAGWDEGGHEAELKRLATELGVAWADLCEQPEWGQREAVGDSGGGISAVPDGRRAEVRASSLWFVGPQFGAAKAAWLRACDAFVLPSYSEGQPVAVLEAWSYAKPVLMTPECNLVEGFGAGAALCIRHPSEMRNAESSPDRAGPIGHRLPVTWQGECRSIAEGLREMMELSDAGRRAMGARGRALVEERFTWPKIARDMQAVYEWVLGGGPKPGWVV